MFLAISSTYLNPSRKKKSNVIIIEKEELMNENFAFVFL